MMVAESSSDSLPPGWEEHTRFSGGKKIKYYTNAATGKKFYSKKSVISYVNTMNDSNRTPQAQSIHGKKKTDGNSTPQPQSINGKEDNEIKALSLDLQGGAQTNESPAWLPPGWIMEIKDRKSGLSNSTYKVYIDPSTGSKFYSKPDVFRYLESQDPSKSKDYMSTRSAARKSTLKQDLSENRSFSLGNSSASKEGNNISSKLSTEIVQADAVESSSLEGSSVAWIVEFKTTKSAHGLQIEPYYTDPVSGYVFRSEGDVLRYLETGDMSQSTIIPKKKDETDSVLTKNVNSSTPTKKPSLKRDVSEHLVLTNGEGSKSEKKNSISKQSLDVVGITSEDGLPAGWIKEIKTRRLGNGIRRDPYYIDPVSGYIFRSKKDALRYIESGDINKCAMKPKKRDSLVLIQENDPESTRDVTNPSPQVGKRYPLRSSGGQLSSDEKLNDGKENRDMSSFPSPKVASSKRKQAPSPKVASSKRKQVEIMPVQVPVTESLALESESSKRKTVNYVSADATGTMPVAAKQVSRRGRKSRKTAQTYESEFQGSQQPNIVSADNRAVSNALTDNLHDQKSQKNMKKQRINRTTPRVSKASKKRITQSICGRTSKRLAGSEPEMPANLQLSERSLRAAIKKSCESEEDILSIITKNGFPSEVPHLPDVEQSLGAAVGKSFDAKLASVSPVRSSEVGQYVSPIMSMNTVAEEIHQPLDPDTALGVADIVSMVVESVSKIDSSEQREEHSAQNQAVLEEKAGGQVNEKQAFENPRAPNPRDTYPFLDSWTDPCLDFAFKTLTGTISVDDKLGYQGSSQNRSEASTYIQRNEYFRPSQNPTDTTTSIQSQNPTDITTYIQRSGYYQQPGSGLSNSQNSTPSLSLNLGEQHVQAQQFPRTPPSPPPGFSLPLFRGIGSQPSSSNTRSDSERNTNYK